MVLDAAKGVEAQTRKLFEVCRLRRVPVLTFINKLDLHGREPVDLMAEVEAVLGIGASPLNWPIGQGPGFAGLVEHATREVQLFTKTAAGGARRVDVEHLALDGPCGEPIVAAVGRLQFDVLQYRLKDEYGMEASLAPMSYPCSAWLESDVAGFQAPVDALVVRDARDRVLVLFSDEWARRYAAKDNPGHRLLDVA
jgi:peptide subunit release factor RF-3